MRADELRMMDAFKVSYGVRSNRGDGMEKLSLIIDLVLSSETVWLKSGGVVNHFFQARV
jgi:hypothetical protein